MNLDDLIARVGEQRFERACELAWDRASYRGRGKPWMPGDGLAWWEDPTHLTDVQQDLGNAIFYDAGRSIADELLPERLALAEQVYRRMPGYANLSAAEPFMTSATFFDCTASALRSLLEDPAEPLANPVAIWLDVDAFEFDPERWWAAMTAGPDYRLRAREAMERYRRRVIRVVEVGREVTWETKLATLRELIDNSRVPPGCVPLLVREQ